MLSKHTQFRRSGKAVEGDVPAFAFLRENPEATTRHLGPVGQYLELPLRGVGLSTDKAELSWRPPANSFSNGGVTEDIFAVDGHGDSPNGWTDG